MGKIVLSPQKLWQKDGFFFFAQSSDLSKIWHFHGQFPQFFYGKIRGKPCPARKNRLLTEIKIFLAKRYIFLRQIVKILLPNLSYFPQIAFNYFMPTLQIMLEAWSFKFRLIHICVMPVLGQKF